MNYNPQQHHRRSIRMPGYDYTEPGAYFVTICTNGRTCLFDDPVLRRVVETYWRSIPRHAAQVALDVSVVMPNHVHGILILQDLAPTCLSGGFIGCYRRHIQGGHRTPHQFHPAHAGSKCMAAQLL
jgi:putative transposase